ncbi:MULTISPECIES: DUF2690 domain-containing protein [unclassified Streptomyces]|uniref:DUF2690 domain-containing protein n=1 Tax=unclassified Streptomyces TaxID=2593676 RepID=UPI002E10D5A7|nr:MULTISPECIES: DUF2690 domain-containing protein [unclassified Streptomyces]WSR23221.1 YjfA family protein [Streptomyces sp. NBC_01205]
MRISVVQKSLAVATASVALAIGFTGSASAAAYDDQDPISSGCANTAITARSSAIYVGSTQVGTIELRYSTACRTVWGRVRSTGPYGTASVTRTSDWEWNRCDSLSWNSSMGQYTCYTAMLNDAGVESYATGSASASNGYNSGDFSTGRY